MDGCVRKGSLPVSASVTDLSGLLWTKIKKRRKNRRLERQFPVWLLPGSVEFGDRRSFASGAVFRNFIGFAQFVVTLLELFHRSLVGRIVNDVFHLHGILFHVKEHPFAAGPDVGKRVAVRPDAVVARGVVFAGIFVKTVVNGIPPWMAPF